MPKKILTYPELADHGIRSSRRQVDRLEAAGKFPRRVQISPGRVGWLAEEIDVFLMDEPTRGIDVGARSEIYGLLYGLAEAGRTVIVVSSDLAEVIGIADRVLVMKEGRIVGDLPKAQASPDALIKLALPR